MIRIIVISEYVARRNIEARRVLDLLAHLVVDAMGRGDEQILAYDGGAADELLLVGLGLVEGRVPGELGDVGPRAVDDERLC